MLGLTMKNGGAEYEVTPHMMGVDSIYAKIPTAKGWLEINVDGDNVDIKEI